MNIDTNEFSTDLLALYYDRLFPYDLFEKWLQYGKDENYMNLREFSFTLENEQYIRYKCFRNAEQMRISVKKDLPYKIDIGAVFSIAPIDKGKVKPNLFIPNERELIFDVDLTDYDDIRTCCKEANICNKCWKFMIVAVKIIHISLVEDFGFKNILWVYSGRRGVHCWIADEKAKKLSNEQRTSILQYFTIINAGTINKKKTVLTRQPYHPFISRSFEILKEFFLEMAQDQNIFSNINNYKNLLKMIPDETIQNQLLEEWKKEDDHEKYNENDSYVLVQQRWQDIQDAIENKINSTYNKKRKTNLDNNANQLKLCMDEIVLYYTYPRLDGNVTKQKNHLLKAPFAVHPKTGKICVPINPEKVDTFDPFDVPTLRILEKDLNKNKIEKAMDDEPTNININDLSENDDHKKKKLMNVASSTSLGPYLDFFKNDFIKNLLEIVTSLKKPKDEMDLNW